MSVRADRIVTPLGGNGVDIHLHDMKSSKAVWWSERGNSYVVTVDTKGEPRIYSINGIGEIRWAVEEWNTDAESEEARAYFLEEGQ